MEKITWRRFYDSFLDLSFDSMKRQAALLTDFGPSRDVLDVIYEFSSHDRKIAGQFAKRAMDAGVRFYAEEMVEIAYLAAEEQVSELVLKYLDMGMHFLPEQVADLPSCVSRAALSRAAESAAGSFQADELQFIRSRIDETSFRRICRKQGITFTEPSRPQKKVVFSVPEPRSPAPRSSNAGCLAGLILGLLRGSSKREKKCCGDCSRCPPHYGYRYGRWYYGHSHTHGCEFGGNRGDGR